jgi:metal-responsive CopG/Arc/MetJ family transcriptional regulator
MSAAEVRTTVLLPADLAEAVDNYRFDHRLNTRPDAIRELLAYALDRKLADLKQELGLTKPAKESRR